jgi:hypothetical protein
MERVHIIDQRRAWPTVKIDIAEQQIRRLDVQGAVHTCAIADAANGVALLTERFSKQSTDQVIIFDDQNVSQLGHAAPLW